MIKWLRLYPEILVDPKLRRLNATQKWLWIAAMCEASNSSDRGRLFIADGIEYTDQDLAHVAGLTVTELDQANGFIEMCVTLKMMERHADGSVTLINFIDRQYEKSSDKPESTRERKRKQRAKEAEEKKKRKEEAEKKANNDAISTDSKRDGHTVEEGKSQDVTPSHALYSDTDTDSDIYSDTDNTTPPKSSYEVVEIGGRDLYVFNSAFDQFERYFGRQASKTISELIHTYLDDGIEMSAIAWAMRESTEKAKGWDYSLGIINKFPERGIKTAAEAEQSKEEHERSKAERANHLQVVPGKKGYGNRPVMQDKFPVAVQRQIEREQLEQPTQVQQKQTIMDDPELKELYESLRQPRRNQA
ncbi:DnaD domain protein [Brevibacillus laterosporus]|uniref:Phage replisome organizer N-terminal domain-containing protein n=1 Tax=Brevibacillus laterosporus TaxID=1465 RepID=A0AAP3DL24_BRELA|nr:DnaD domain protein [Brevibacillus laterosporus]MCR8982630.1 phage replisome organizer N-terminal domain-containing protein [Brevibacillus laterosporus]MCZ0809786.1 phage replisome organizer N-terminal domain-containing protein [Brevibacillus laterosporus]MCZ0828380.1 phage replisome organizer N-terminal domain-containing protein [Brevibacillus laterosporus]MCZ0852390.1 phage replisome organizer N-terminal domain-containing protein [Brevibacillus laterosporus]